MTFPLKASFKRGDVALPEAIQIGRQAQNKLRYGREAELHHVHRSCNNLNGLHEMSPIFTPVDQVFCDAWVWTSGCSEEACHAYAKADE